MTDSRWKRPSATNTTASQFVSTGEVQPRVSPAERGKEAAEGRGETGQLRRPPEESGLA
jgi:hypothetical protein